MNVAVTGLDELGRLAERLQADPADRGAALDRFLAVYREALDRIVPVRSGNLRSRVRVTAGDGEALVEADAPYALYVVLGVEAQWMRWLEGKTVSFIAKDGERVTRRAVRVGMWGGRAHWWRPATPPNDFFRRALEDPRVAAALDALGEADMPVQVAYTYQVRG